MMENSAGLVIAYICGTPDAKQFNRNKEMCWYPAMIEKYPLEIINDDSIREYIEYFHSSKVDVPVEVLATYPGAMTCGTLKEFDEEKRLLLTVLLAALRSNGCFGVHVSVNPKDQQSHQFYAKLGLVDVYDDSLNQRLYLGRKF